jgi:hypothetical protein
MKVLKKVDTSDWKYRFTCTKCDSELEAEAKDVLCRHHPDSSDMRESYPAYDTFHVLCCVCNNERTVPDKDIPKALQHEVKERSQRRSTSYFDR